MLAPSTTQAGIDDVWLHGEVVENDTGGGPRLDVKIEPLDADGRTVRFRGPLSLMLLGLDDDGAQRSLARWDFTPQEVEGAIDTATRHTIQFHLELPPEVPVDAVVQLWVRLLPRHAEKVLAHADLHLAEPSNFSSLAEPPVPHSLPQDEPAAALALNAPANPLRQVHTELAGSDWSTAKPGEPATLPQENANGQWRASSEPVPPVIAMSPPARPSPSIKQRATQPRSVSSSKNIAKPPSWAADRSAASSEAARRTASMPARPRWTPTR
jgi:hypothetical protein